MPTMNQIPDPADRPRVVVVGSINVDLVAHVDRLPGRGETVAGGRLERSGGGKGANQAVAAARAGAAVTMVGAVGDDDLGADALAELRGEGIDVAGVARLAGAPTGVALIVVDGAGDNQIAVASGANHAVTEAHVQAGLGALRGERACVLVSFELADAPVVAAARIARAAGARLVVDPAPARRLAPALIELEPLLTPNAQEATALTGCEDPQAAARALSAATGAPVVVTLGARGALIVEADHATTVAAPTVEAVDTTGAGDAFAGVLAAALARRCELRAAVEAAVQAAAQSVITTGARTTR
jgi:ribokinase